MGFDCSTDNNFAQLEFEGYQRLCQSEATKKQPFTSEKITLS